MTQYVGRVRPATEPTHAAYGRATPAWLAQRRKWAALVAILVAAFAIRLIAAIALPNIAHPDEIFQVVEPAHRLVFGSGIVPWEYIVGIRSWAFPGLIAGVMEIARGLGDDPRLLFGAIAAAMAAASLVVVACGFLWGYRLCGLPAAIIVGAVLAVWVDLVYFATHPLSEVIAADCLVAGLYLAYPERRDSGRARLFLAGLLLGLTFLFRFQLAPAIAVAGLWIGGRAIRARWLPLIGGGMVPVLLAGLLDALTWSYPFQTIWLNFWVNVVLQASEYWGTSAWYKLVGLLILSWGGSFVLIGLAALWGARRLPLLLLVAATIVAAHSLIPHKEYRFIYPALPLIMILAGIGTAELVIAARRLTARPAGWHLPAAVAVAIAFWSATSAAVAIGAPERSLWLSRRGEIAAFDALSRADEVCGIGLYGIDVWLTPGYSRLRRAVPFYDVAAADLAARAPAFNRLLAYEGTPVLDASFGDRQCFDNGFDEWNRPRPAFCIWRRAGSCQPDDRTGPATLWPPQLRGWGPAPPR
jgi:phosphatidylinositol glycan class B